LTLPIAVLSSVCLSAGEDWRPFFDESAGGFLVIFGTPGFDLVARFEIKQRRKSRGFRRIEIFFHHGERDARSFQ